MQTQPQETRVVTVRLPMRLFKQAEEQMRERGYLNVSEYLRSLVHAARPGEGA